MSLNCTIYIYTVSCKMKTAFGDFSSTIVYIVDALFLKNVLHCTVASVVLQTCCCVPLVFLRTAAVFVRQLTSTQTLRQNKFVFVFDS